MLKYGNRSCSVDEFARQYLQLEPLIQDATGTNRYRRLVAYRSLAARLHTDVWTVFSFEKIFRKHYFYKIHSLVGKGVYSYAQLPSKPSWLKLAEQKLKLLPKVRSQYDKPLPPSPEEVLDALCVQAMKCAALHATSIYINIKENVIPTASLEEIQDIWSIAQKLSIQYLALSARSGDTYTVAPSILRVADVVLLYTDNERKCRLITNESEQMYLESEALSFLWYLVQRHKIEHQNKKNERTRQWLLVWSEYCATGRQVSIIVLQRRWYELKWRARKKVLDCWRIAGKNFYNHINKRRKNIELPMKIYLDIVRKYPRIVLNPLPSWRVLVDIRYVVTEENIYDIRHIGSINMSPGSYSSNFVEESRPQHALNFKLRSLTPKKDKTEDKSKNKKSPLDSKNDKNNKEFDKLTNKRTVFLDGEQKEINKIDYQDATHAIKVKINQEIIDSKTKYETINGYSRLTQHEFCTIDFDPKILAEPKIVLTSLHLNASWVKYSISNRYINIKRFKASIRKIKFDDSKWNKMDEEDDTPFHLNTKTKLIDMSVFGYNVSEIKSVGDRDKNKHDGREINKTGAKLTKLVDYDSSEESDEDFTPDAIGWDIFLSITTKEQNIPKIEHLAALLDVLWEATAQNPLAYEHIEYCCPARKYWDMSNARQRLAAMAIHNYIHARFCNCCCQTLLTGFLLRRFKDSLRVLHELIRRSTLEKGERSSVACHDRKQEITREQPQRKDVPQAYKISNDIHLIHKCRPSSPSSDIEIDSFREKLVLVNSFDYLLPDTENNNNKSTKPNLNIIKETTIDLTKTKPYDIKVKEVKSAASDKKKIDKLFGDLKANHNKIIDLTEEEGYLITGTSQDKEITYINIDLTAPVLKKIQSTSPKLNEKHKDDSDVSKLNEELEEKVLDLWQMPQPAMECKIKKNSSPRLFEDLVSDIPMLESNSPEQPITSPIPSTSTIPQYKLLNTCKPLKTYIKHSDPKTNIKRHLVTPSSDKKTENRSTNTLTNEMSKKNMEDGVSSLLEKIKRDVAVNMAIVEANSNPIETNKCIIQKNQKAVEAGKSTSFLLKDQINNKISFSQPESNQIKKLAVPTQISSIKHVSSILNLRETLIGCIRNTINKTSKTALNAINTKDKEPKIVTRSENVMQNATVSLNSNNEISKTDIQKHKEIDTNIQIATQLKKPVILQNNNLLKRNLSKHVKDEESSEMAANEDSEKPNTKPIQAGVYSNKLFPQKNEGSMKEKATNCFLLRKIMNYNTKAQPASNKIVNPVLSKQNQKSVTNAGSNFLNVCKPITTSTVYPYNKTDRNAIEGREKESKKVTQSYGETKIATDNTPTRPAEDSKTDIQKQTRIVTEHDKIAKDQTDFFLEKILSEDASDKELSQERNKQEMTANLENVKSSIKFIEKDVSSNKPVLQKNEQSIKEKASNNLLNKCEPINTYIGNSITKKTNKTDRNDNETKAKEFKMVTQSHGKTINTRDNTTIRNIANPIIKKCKTDLYAKETKESEFKIVKLSHDETNKVTDNKPTQTLKSLILFTQPEHTSNNEVPQSDVQKQKENETQIVTASSKITDAQVKNLIKILSEETIDERLQNETMVENKEKVKSSTKSIDKDVSSNKLVIQKNAEPIKEKGLSTNFVTKQRNEKMSTLQPASRDKLVSHLPVSIKIQSSKWLEIIKQKTPAKIDNLKSSTKPTDGNIGASYKLFIQNKEAGSMKEKEPERLINSNMSTLQPKPEKKLVVDAPESKEPEKKEYKIIGQTCGVGLKLKLTAKTPKAIPIPVKTDTESVSINVKSKFNKLKKPKEVNIVTNAVTCPNQTANNLPQKTKKQDVSNSTSKIKQGLKSNMRSQKSNKELFTGDKTSDITSPKNKQKKKQKTFEKPINIICPSQLEPTPLVSIAKITKNENRLKKTSTKSGPNFMTTCIPQITNTVKPKTKTKGTDNNVVKKKQKDIQIISKSEEQKNKSSDKTPKLVISPISANEIKIIAPNLNTNQKQNNTNFETHSDPDQNANLSNKNLSQEETEQNILDCKQMAAANKNLKSGTASIGVSPKAMSTLCNQRKDLINQNWKTLKEQERNEISTSQLTTKNRPIPSMSVTKPFVNRTMSKPTLTHALNDLKILTTLNASVAESKNEMSVTTVVHHESGTIEKDFEIAVQVNDKNQNAADTEAKPVSIAITSTQSPLILNNLLPKYELLKKHESMAYANMIQTDEVAKEKPQFVFKDLPPINTGVLCKLNFLHNLQLHELENNKEEKSETETKVIPPSDQFKHHQNKTIISKNCPPDETRGEIKLNFLQKLQLQAVEHRKRVKSGTEEIVISLSDTLYHQKKKEKSTEEKNSTSLILKEQNNNEIYLSQVTSKVWPISPVPVSDLLQKPVEILNIPTETSTKTPKNVSNSIVQDINTVSIEGSQTVVIHAPRETKEDLSLENPVLKNITIKQACEENSSTVKSKQRWHKPIILRNNKKSIRGYHNDHNYAHEPFIRSLGDVKCTCNPERSSHQIIKQGEVIHVDKTRFGENNVVLNEIVENDSKDVPNNLTLMQTDFVFRQNERFIHNDIMKEKGQCNAPSYSSTPPSKDLTGNNIHHKAAYEKDNPTFLILETALQSTDENINVADIDDNRTQNLGNTFQPLIDTETKSTANDGHKVISIRTPIKQYGHPARQYEMDTSTVPELNRNDFLKPVKQAILYASPIAPLGLQTELLQTETRNKTLDDRELFPNAVWVFDELESNKPETQITEDDNESLLIFPFPELKSTPDNSKNLCDTDENNLTEVNDELNELINQTSDGIRKTSMHRIPSSSSGKKPVISGPEPKRKEQETQSMRRASHTAILNNISNIQKSSSEDGKNSLKLTTTIITESQNEAPVSRPVKLKNREKSNNDETHLGVISSKKHHSNNVAKSQKPLFFNSAHSERLSVRESSCFAEDNNNIDDIVIIDDDSNPDNNQNSFYDKSQPMKQTSLEIERKENNKLYNDDIIIVDDDSIGLDIFTASEPQSCLPINNNLYDKNYDAVVLEDPNEAVVLTQKPLSFDNSSGKEATSLQSESYQKRQESLLERKPDENNILNEMNCVSNIIIVHNDNDDKNTTSEQQTCLPVNDNNSDGKTVNVFVKTNGTVVLNQKSFFFDNASGNEPTTNVSRSHQMRQKSLLLDKKHKKEYSLEDSENLSFNKSDINDQQKFITAVNNIPDDKNVNVSEQSNFDVTLTEKCFDNASSNEQNTSNFQYRQKRRMSLLQNTKGNTENKKTLQTDTIIINENNTNEQESFITEDDKNVGAENVCEKSNRSITLTKKSLSTDKLSDDEQATASESHNKIQKTVMEILSTKRKTLKEYIQYKIDDIVTIQKSKDVDNNYILNAPDHTNTRQHSLPEIKGKKTNCLIDGTGDHEDDIVNVDNDRTDMNGEQSCLHKDNNNVDDTNANISVKPNLPVTAIQHFLSYDTPSENEKTVTNSEKQLLVTVNPIHKSSLVDNLNDNDHSNTKFESHSIRKKPVLKISQKGKRTVPRRDGSNNIKTGFIKKSKRKKKQTLKQIDHGNMNRNLKTGNDEILNSETEENNNNIDNRDKSHNPNDNLQIAMKSKNTLSSRKSQPKIKRKITKLEDKVIKVCRRHIGTNKQIALSVKDISYLDDGNANISNKSPDYVAAIQKSLSVDKVNEIENVTGGEHTAKKSESGFKRRKSSTGIKCNKKRSLDANDDNIEDTETDTSINLKGRKKVKLDGKQHLCFVEDTNTNKNDKQADISEKSCGLVNSQPDDSQSVNVANSTLKSQKKRSVSRNNKCNTHEINDQELESTTIFKTHKKRKRKHNKEAKSEHTSKGAKRQRSDNRYLENGTKDHDENISITEIKDTSLNNSESCSEIDCCHDTQKTTKEIHGNGKSKHKQNKQQGKNKLVPNIAKRRESVRKSNNDVYNEQLSITHEINDMSINNESDGSSDIGTDYHLYDSTILQSPKSHHCENNDSMKVILKSPESENIQNNEKHTEIQENEFINSERFQNANVESANESNTQKNSEYNYSDLNSHSNEVLDKLNSLKALNTSITPKTNTNATCNKILVVKISDENKLTVISTNSNLASQKENSKICILEDIRIVPLKPTKVEEKNTEEANIETNQSDSCITEFVSDYETTDFEGLEEDMLSNPSKELTLDGGTSTEDLHSQHGFTEIPLPMGAPQNVLSDRNINEIPLPSIPTDHDTTQNKDNTLEISNTEADRQPSPFKPPLPEGSPLPIDIDLVKLEPEDNETDLENNIPSAPAVPENPNSLPDTEPDAINTIPEFGVENISRTKPEDSQIDFSHYEQKMPGMNTCVPNNYVQQNQFRLNSPTNNYNGCTCGFYNNYYTSRYSKMSSYSRGQPIDSSRYHSINNSNSNMNNIEHIYNYQRNYNQHNCCVRNHHHVSGRFNNFKCGRALNLPPQQSWPLALQRQRILFSTPPPPLPRMQPSLLQRPPTSTPPQRQGKPQPQPQPTRLPHLQGQQHPQQQHHLQRQLPPSLPPPQTQARPQIGVNTLSNQILDPRLQQLQNNSSTTYQNMNTQEPGPSSQNLPIAGNSLREKKQIINVHKKDNERVQTQNVPKLILIFDLNCDPINLMQGYYILTDASIACAKPVYGILHSTGKLTYADESTSTNIKNMLKDKNSKNGGNECIVQPGNTMDNRVESPLTNTDIMTVLNNIKQCHDLLSNGAYMKIMLYELATGETFLMHRHSFREVVILYADVNDSSVLEDLVAQLNVIRPIYSTISSYDFND